MAAAHGDVADTEVGPPQVKRKVVAPFAPRRQMLHVGRDHGKGAGGVAIQGAPCLNKRAGEFDLKPSKRARRSKKSPGG